MSISPGASYLRQDEMDLGWREAGQATRPRFVSTLHTFSWDTPGDVMLLRQ
jgi:hypothetical protein